VQNLIEARLLLEQERTRPKPVRLSTGKTLF